MLSSEKIKENYSKLSEDELLKIVNEISSLRKDVIPILQDELKNRNLTDGLEKINNYLLKEVSKKPDDNFDPQKYIEEQLKKGYSLETIKHQLDHMNINMFEVIRNKRNDEKFIKQYIITNKKKGKRIVKIAKELEKNFNIPTEVTKAYNEILKKDAKKKTFIGVGLIIFSIVASFLRGGIGISSVIIFLLGLWYAGSKKV